MSRSTTGAYGNFPDYYYERGNLFGSYLLGDAPPLSADTRKELEVVGGGSSLINPTRPGSRPSDRTPHAALMEYVRANVDRTDASYLLAALVEARGAPLARSNGSDPYGQLDEFFNSYLTSGQQREVLKRLRAAVAEGNRRMRRRLAGARRSRKAKSRKRPRRSNVKEVWVGRNGPGQCGICGGNISDEARAACAAERELFQGHAYCMEHIEKPRRTLTRSE
jgi:hypothetical protein